MSLPIVKERYGADELEQSLRDVGVLGDDLSEERYDLRLNVAQELYFRGLVHGRADVEKIESVRAAFGY
ncbi:hypothetical protein [Halosegnis longus]|uniref:hypothetical protein n=1 Tax=Halosegnis longus TaxID=2216012 RepID=UPI00096A6DDF|nr:MULTISPECIES: hypothetical protein [Halobacteriales]